MKAPTFTTEQPDLPDASELDPSLDMGIVDITRGQPWLRKQLKNQPAGRRPWDAANANVRKYFNIYLQEETMMKLEYLIDRRVVRNKTEFMRGAIEWCLEKALSDYEAQMKAMAEASKKKSVEK